MAKKNPTQRFLNRLVDRTHSLVYFVDEACHLKFANESLARWSGIELAHLKDRRLVYAPADPQADDQARGLCPPPEWFQSEQDAHAFSITRVRQGKLEYCPATAVRMEGEGLGRGFWIVADPDQTADSPAAVPGGALPVSARETLHHAYARLVVDCRDAVKVESLVGTSSHAQRIRKQVRVAAQSQCDTMIWGPFGCGKEYLARGIFSMYPGKDSGELAPVYCAIADAELVQQRIQDARNLMRQRDSSQLYLLLLDIDKLSPEGQSELLGFLELPEMKLGTLSTSTRSADELIAADDFSTPLVHRLSALTIEVLALERRVADIALLAQSMLEQSNATHRRQLSGFDEWVLEQFAEYRWPENLNELRRVVTAAVDASSGAVVTRADLPDAFVQAMVAQRIGRPVEVSIQLDDYLAAIERSLLERALTQTRGNKTQASKQLGISRPRLLRRLQQLGLDQFLVTATEKDDQQIDSSAFEELVDE